MNINRISIIVNLAILIFSSYLTWFIIFGYTYDKIKVYPSEGITLLEQSGNCVSIQRNYTRNNGSKWSVKLGYGQSEVWGQADTLSEAAIDAKTKTDCFKRHCEDCIGEK